MRLVRVDQSPPGVYVSRKYRSSRPVRSLASILNMSAMLRSSPYIRLYCFHVPWPKDRRPSFCHSLQGLSAEHPGTSRDHAGLLDHRRLPALRSEAPVFTSGHFPGSAVAPRVGKTLRGRKSAVIHGRDEASHSSRRTGADQGDGRAEAYDRPLRFDAGDCRLDHCGCTTREGAGDQ
jgi:hypothetical protein